MEITYSPQVNLPPKTLVSKNTKKERTTLLAHSVKTNLIENRWHLSFGGVKTPHIERFFEDIKFENAKKWVPSGKDDGKEIPVPNEQGIKKLEFLQTLTSEEKKTLVSSFCEKTGFPNMPLVATKMKLEAQRVAHKLAKEENFEIKLGVFDQNCSIGRNLAFPGSDMDALFYIVDGPTVKQNELYHRWKFTQITDQRILGLAVTHPPEVFPLESFKKGLNLAAKAFDDMKRELTPEDFKRFKQNMEAPTNDFVSAADFNIRLMQHIPKEDKWDVVKTAMTVEMFRNGKFLENNLDAQTIGEIKSSPLMQWSNIMQQKALKNSKKQKIADRESLQKEFPIWSDDKKFELIKSIIEASFEVKPPQNNELSKYFYNLNETTEKTSTQGEMGNIWHMYDLMTN